VSLVCFFVILGSSHYRKRDERSVRKAQKKKIMLKRKDLHFPYIARSFEIKFEGLEKAKYKRLHRDKADFFENTTVTKKLLRNGGPLPDD